MVALEAVLKGLAQVFPQANEVRILLDTDHFRVLGLPHSTSREGLAARMRASADQHLAITIVTVEEQMGDWCLVNLRFTGADPCRLARQVKEFCG